MGKPFVSTEKDRTRFELPLIKMPCSICNALMEVTIETEREEQYIWKYYKWTCPNCGHIHTEEI